MRIRLIFTLIFTILIINFSQAQKQRTDANITGHVVDSKGEHIPFASVTVKGTTIGTITDETGHYQLINLPEGELVIEADCMGCKPDEVSITIKAGESKEIKFELEEEAMDIQEVVVTGDRTGKSRDESSVIVNSLKPKIFQATHSITLDESLDFSPGLRMENNCQNCGFSQVRMNGMEGPYSQILIDSRPIFSGLAGVYGLELIPSNMIERVEVIRGGGSALYGSNAIAGTVNLILKEPKNNFYEFGVSGNSIGAANDYPNPAEDYTANFNTSVVSSDNKTGMALYGFYREKEPFDANDDGFSELASIENITVGSRLFHRFDTRNKLTIDFFHIDEDRRGGNKHDYLPHLADIAEQVTHKISTGAITYDQFFNEKDLLSVYASGQKINRDSYYGAEQSLRDYGNTENFTHTIGAQYTDHTNRGNFTVGIENSGEWLKDKKMGYPDIENADIDYTDSTLSIESRDNRTIADQTINTAGVFAQYEINWEQLQVSVGGRFDHYAIDDKSKDNSDVSGNVFSPRITLKYDAMESLQLRTSYAQGYRAPQIYDEDLHIETSGARKVIHENAPDLQQEASHSYMASLDYNRQVGNNNYINFLVEGFYTQLNDAFVNEFGDSDDEGTVVYTRKNAEEGAVVKGVNMEMNLTSSNNWEFKAGYTMQTSKYKQPHEFNKKAFFRTPDNYGYFTVDWDATEHIEISSSGNYTGIMYIPYFGPELTEPEEGELRRSNPFFDWGMKVNYKIRINGAKLQVFGGIKNILNSYQNDFDQGIERDPAYIYGPRAPRTIYFGIKVGNKL
ncbi:MAG: TonB-dependent receptor [Bacteroidales bacterium]